MARKRTETRIQFQQVLSEAIDDLMEHGFDSAARVEEWVRKLEQAARTSLVPEAVLQRGVREALTQAYERTVDSDRLYERHPGVGRYTLERIKPKLRAELDRRILASASLIRLNRDQSIQRTLQRFQGWATSIPIGGTEATKRREVKQEIKRGIAGLPFTERRVVVDQGHKLISTLNDIVATDAGAIAFTWHHVMEGGGYQARVSHLARNGKVYVIRGNWAIEKGLMKLAGRQYADEITAVGEEIGCRCWASYIYAIRDLPPDMLTAKGKEALTAGRVQVSSWHTSASL